MRSLRLLPGRRRRQGQDDVCPRPALRQGEPVQTPVAPNPVIQGLWIGPELSVMEQLSISSFLLNGHQYHLYVYDDTKNIPRGTVVVDANEILPASRIFQYRDRQTVAGFSNFFRYKLLLERGGWWVDTDVVCLKPFDFPEDHVFSSQADRDEDVANSGIIKAPAGSQAMAYTWEICQAKDPERLRWGETGPFLMQQVVSRFGFERHLQSRHAFCPLDYPSWRLVLEPAAGPLFDERA
jgi:hypothetical protein